MPHRLTFVITKHCRCICGHPMHRHVAEEIAASSLSQRHRFGVVLQKAPLLANCKLLYGLPIGST